MKTVLFCFILSLYVTTLSAEDLYLRDNLHKAHPGDYVVIANDKNKTLMRVIENNQDTIIIEEITVPGRMTRMIKSWRAWVESGAPNHTAWVRYKVDLNTGHTHEFLALNQEGWHDMPQVNHLFSTLLNLHFTKVSDRNRRRVGNHRGSNNIDPRFFWNPPLVIDGQKVRGALFEAWHARWPKDGSDLSGKPLEIYLPTASNNTNYPSYFPYWIEVTSGFIVRMHVSDSGVLPVVSSQN